MSKKSIDEGETQQPNAVIVQHAETMENQLEYPV